MGGKECTYCGAIGEIEREHVIPAVFYMIRSYDPNQQWIVPACPTCNSLASSKLFFAIPDKANYILKRYRSRFRKYLSMPSWTPDELDEMSRILRTGIEHSIMAKALVQRRIAYLESVTDYAKDYLRPQWVEDEYKKFLREMKQRKRKPKKKTLPPTSNTGVPRS